MQIESDIKLDFDDVLIRPKRSTLTSRSDVDLSRTFKFKNGGIYTGIPIMAANMDGVGTLTMASELTKAGMFTCLTKDVSATKYSELPPQYNGHVAYTLGISADDVSGLMNKLLTKHNIKYICVDVANGYTERFINVVSSIRKLEPDITIIAGNVATREITEELILNGVDIVKVGIGPGSVCTTRIQTGVGYPQLSAIIECADAAHGLGGHIIADGGCNTVGDIAKAFGAGADFVMLGGMFSGHDEGEGEPYFEDGVIKGVKFYGMSSKEANTKHFGGLKDYRASEGREVIVPYKGPVATTVQEILGGLRSTCTYVGASSLKELSKRTTFVRVNNTHNRIFEEKKK